MRSARRTTSPHSAPASVSPVLTVSVRLARHAARAGLLGAAALSASAACQQSPEHVADGDDPLAALRVTAESKRYDELYWRAHRDAKDSAQHALYAKAVEYCSQKDVAIDGAKPNCRGVMTTRALEMHPMPPRQSF